ncbi:MAG: CpsD/CapB family tyrosine-protein kinase [Candidatus Omnitrophica bacterium]|nr:CpsD/CapB family tyrosine-protein kinase [Candidatus Omnitrophota bacterium]
MSKITKALEKAARERLQREQEHPTVSPVVTQVSLAIAEAEGIASAGQVTIDPHIVAATDASSPIAEQYRILRTNLQSLRLRSGPKVVVVTSAMHSEGKTVTAVNLALTLARQEGLRVVLVDADLRKGSVHQWLGLGERTTGLATVLANGGLLNGALVRLETPPLAALLAGPKPEHPAELLQSAAMPRLLAALKTQFDVIVVDAPPVLPVADPSILGAYADGVLLVVKAGVTQRRVVQQAKALLQQAKVPLLGCVLTNVAFDPTGLYRYYRYYRDGHAPAAAANGNAAPAAESAAA